jgi:hypothetical protein
LDAALLTDFGRVAGLWWLYCGVDEASVVDAESAASVGEASSVATIEGAAALVRIVEWRKKTRRVSRRGLPVPALRQ